ncbi:MAG: alpha/beta hydrolase fold domain-containing protein [Mangrovibacterium sp.]
MQKLVFSLIGLLLANVAIAQPAARLTAEPDTSYNTPSDYRKTVKYFPNIRIVPDSINKKQVKEIRNIIYTQVDGKDLHLSAFVPKKAKKPTPAIIIIHGGGWRSGNYKQHIPLAQHLAAKGYACFTIEYRLSTEALYPAALCDISAAVRYVRANAKEFKVNPNHIATLGFSAGGHLAALFGAASQLPAFNNVSSYKNTSSKVNAVIDIDGTLSFMHPESSETQNPNKEGASAWWIGYPRTKRLDLWKEASPLTYAESNQAPFLFLNSSINRMHAGRDDFRKALTKNNVYSKVYTFPDTPHSFCLYYPWFPIVVEQIDLFLVKVFN